jgi:hypothetical protein
LFAHALHLEARLKLFDGEIRGGETHLIFYPFAESNWKWASPRCRETRINAERKDVDEFQQGAVELTFTDLLVCCLRHLIGKYAFLRSC